MYFNMSKKTGQFTPIQLKRLPKLGYWLDCRYPQLGNPSAYCILNGECKYIHWSWGTGWCTLFWSCAPTNADCSDPRMEYYATHADMMNAHPEFANTMYSIKAPNDK
jgi:hypothetical protein